MTYFTAQEQACKCCGLIRLADGFLGELDMLRETCGHPLSVNSMCRCEKHNKAVGGAKASYHLTTHSWGCCAADISVIGWSGEKKFHFVKLAMARGFAIGIAKTFIHVDLRRKYTDAKPVLYSY